MASVFAPLLFRPREVSPDDLHAIPKFRDLLQLILEHVEDIFPPTSSFEW